MSTKLNEEQLQSRYRQLFESTQDGLLLINADSMEIEDVNPKLENILGYSKSDLFGKKLWETGLFDDHKLCKTISLQLSENNNTKFDQINLKTGLDQMIVVQLVSCTYEDSGGRIIQCSIQDISFRLQSESEVRALDKNFKGVIEQSIAGFYIIQDGKFVYINPRGIEIFGCTSKSEIIGTSLLDRIGTNDFGKVSEIMCKLDSGDEATMAFDFEVLRKDGVRITVGLNAARAIHCNRPALIGLLQDISEKKHNEHKILEHMNQLRVALMSTVEVINVISELRDPYTASHERRVADIAVAIGREIGLNQDRLEGLEIAGQLHDLGKLNIPTDILSKPGKLSDIEYKLVQSHSQIGYDILKNVKFPWPVAQITLQHHERQDGSGYPQGLKGEEIIMEARIMAVSDVIEAMFSHRPYRPGLGIDKALAEIERGRGTQYDPDVVDASLRLFRENGYEIPGWYY